MGRVSPSARDVAILPPTCVCDCLRPWAWLSPLSLAIAGCGGGGTPTPVPTRPGTISTPAGVSVASGQGSDSDEGAVPNQPVPTPDSAAPALKIPLESPYELGDGFGLPRARGQMHGGLDFVAEGPTDVMAACAGKVTLAGPSDAYSLVVTIDCGGGWSIVAGYLGTLATSAGQTVTLGQTIATVDAANPAIHVELRWENVPVDPAQYFDFNESPPETPAAEATPVLPGPTVQPTRPAGSAGATPTVEGQQPTSASSPVSATPTLRSGPTARPTPTPIPTATPTASPTPPPTATATPTPRRLPATPTPLPVPGVGGGWDFT